MGKRILTLFVAVCVAAPGVAAVGGSRVHADIMLTVEADFPFIHPISGGFPPPGNGPASGGHQGYDIFGLTVNEPIYAAHSGLATIDNDAQVCTPSTKGGGKQIVIQHGGGTAGNNSVYTRYHHLSSYAISSGTWVAAGDLIGYQGQTGHIPTCAEHLHLEFRRMPLESGFYLKHTDLLPDTTITAGSPIDFDGTWRLTTSGDSTTEYTVVYGSAGDVPVTGDWDGDGRDSLGYVRIDSAGLYWWRLSDTDINASSSTQMTTHAGPFNWGVRGDKILTGDWDGDNDDTPGIVRVDNPGVQGSLTSFWITNNKTAGGAVAVSSWGSWPGRYPVKGDWDANGADSPGVYWPQGAGWYLTNSLMPTGNPLSYTPYSWGQVADVPMVGDWQFNNFDRSIVLQKTPNNFGQAMIWYRNPYLLASSNPADLNPFSYGSLGDYPMVFNFDTDTLDEFGVVD